MAFDDLRAFVIHLEKHGHLKRIPATVVPFPFYDPDKTRPRS